MSPTRLTPFRGGEEGTNGKESLHKGNLLEFLPSHIESNKE